MEKLDIFVGWLVELKNFTQGQAPEAVKELMEYSVYIDRKMLWVFGVVAIIGLAVIIVDASVSTYGPSPLSFLGFAMLCAGILFCICNYMELKKIQMAPKIFAAEYIANQIKSVKGG